MMEREGAEIRRQKILGGELEDLAVEVAGRAAPVFRAMGWEWRDIGVPGEAQIAATLLPPHLSGRRERRLHHGIGTL